MYLLGQSSLRPRVSDLAGSEYLRTIHDRVAGRPAIDLALERRVQSLCRQAIAGGILASAHDCSEGGLAIALAESSIASKVGFRGGPALARLPRRWDCSFFGERQSRIVVSLRPENAPALQRMAAAANVPLLELGRTGGSRFRLGSYAELPVSEIAAAWEGGLEKALES